LIGMCLMLFIIFHESRYVNKYKKPKILEILLEVMDYLCDVIHRNLHHDDFFFILFSKRNDDSNVVIVVNYGVASFSSWSKSICNPETCITRIRRPLMTIASF
jgi:hypothetical protein